MYSIKFVVILKLVPSRPFRAQCGKSVVITHSAVFGAHLLLIEYKRETLRGIPGAFRCSRDLIEQNHKFVATYMVT